MVVDPEQTADDRSAEAPASSRRDRISGRAATHKHLLAGSAALVVGAAVQALTGAVFWLVAARIDTTTDVGRATALFTSVLFIAYLAGLGLQVSLARFAPGRDDESHTVFSWAVVATVVWSAVATAVIVFVVRAICGLRADDDEMEVGLDLSYHGERDYNL